MVLDAAVVYSCDHLYEEIRVVGVRKYSMFINGMYVLPRIWVR